jgi:hypothetical protein
MNMVVGVAGSFVILGLTILFWQNYGDYALVCWAITSLNPFMWLVTAMAFIDDFPAVEQIGRRMRSGGNDDY